LNGLAVDGPGGPNGKFFIIQTLRMGSWVTPRRKDFVSCHTAVRRDIAKKIEGILEVDVVCLPKEGSIDSSQSIRKELSEEVKRS